MKKSERLICLLEFLRKGGKASLKEIVANCRISERTVYRDIRSLTELGFPINFDDGYHLNNLMHHPELNRLNESELRLVKFALETHPLGTLFPFAALAARLDIAKAPISHNINLGVESDFTLDKNASANRLLGKPPSSDAARWLPKVAADKEET